METGAIQGTAGLGGGLLWYIIILFGDRGHLGYSGRASGTSSYSPRYGDRGHLGYRRGGLPVWYGMETGVSQGTAGGGSQPKVWRQGPFRVQQGEGLWYYSARAGMETGAIQSTKEDLYTQSISQNVVFV